MLEPFSLHCITIILDAFVFYLALLKFYSPTHLLIFETQKLLLLLEEQYIFLPFNGLPLCHKANVVSQNYQDVTCIL